MDTRKNALMGALALILGMPLAGHAQTDEEDFVSSVEVIPDFYNNSGIVDSASGAIGSAEVDVDPHSGTLTIAHTDVSIPGNGGLDLNLTRYYHSLHPQAENFYSPAGVGWTLHFGKIMTSRPASMCNPIYNAHIQDNPVYLAPDGSRRPLAIGVRADSGGPDGMVDQANFRYITRNFDAVFCEGYDDPDPTNDKIWMRTPDGKRYDFTSRHLDTLYDSPAVWYVNKITDPNGNWIEIHYQDSGVLGNSNQLIDYVETSDGRHVDFGYELENTNRARLTFIEYDGKRWNYTYEDSDVTQGGLPRNDYYKSSNLTGVTTPDGDQWQYTYYGYTNGTESGGGSLKTMTNPYGGVTTVTYQVTVAYAFDALNRILNRTVTRLERAGHSTYDYSYTRDSSGDTTSVVSDIGTTTYYFDGLRSVSDGEVWRIGVPREKIFDPISGPTSTTTYNYDRIPISFESDIRRERIGFNIPEDQRYFLPVLRGETFSMDQQDWEKNYDYGYQNWGKDNWYLFSPLRLYWIDETGPSGSRTLGNVFQDLSDYYMFGVRASGGVKVYTTGAVYENTRDFDEKGNIVKTMERSLGTTHTVDGEGNRTSSVTDGGVSRSFSRYERGQPGRIVTPGGLTIDQDIDAFGRVKARSFAGGTESIERDVAGRVQSVDPLQGLPTSVSWTSHSAVMTRGSLTHTYGFDDYRRVISETISAPGMETVNISREYDSQDNVTTVTVNGSWVNYDYDGYGRITAINDNGAVTSFSYSPDAVTITNEVSGLTRHAIRSYSGPFTYEIMSVEQQGGVDIDIDRNEFGLVTRLASGGVERLYDYAGTYFYLHAYEEPETGRTEYAYNVDGQLRGELRYGNAGSENLLRLRELVYDDAGRVDWESVKAGGDRERLINYVYDVLDRPTSVNVQILEGGSLRDEVTTDFVYDLDDSVLSKSVTVDDRSWQFTYAYDDYRNRTGVTYPSGNHYQIQANALGQVLTYQGFAEQADYHFSGALASLDFANGDHYTTQLNDRRVLASMNVTGTNQTLIGLAYDYDDALNLTGVDDLADGTRGLVAGYDEHSRLTSASTDRHSYSYDYDALNNLSAISRDGDTSTLNYNAKNLLTHPDSDAPHKYAYNDLGEAETFGFYSGAQIPPSGSFSWEAYPRSAEGQLAGSYERHLYTSNAIRDFGEAYLYDHRGYLLRTQPRNVHYPADGSASQVTEPRKPVYTLYNGQGRLAYELDSETGFQKEYHYLAGRLIGMTSIEYTCEDDVDGDGMGYCFEREYGFDFTVDDGGGDRDGDGLTNAEEFLAGSNPDQADTDGDLMPDAWEVAWGLDPAVDNAASDTDGDGLGDTEEFVAGYDPSTPNLPDQIGTFDLSVSSQALHFQWNSDQSPRVRVYAGTNQSDLAPVKDIDQTDAMVDASVIPQSGYVALAAYNNTGETQLSEILFYDTTAGWGSIEIPVPNSSVYYADQRGLVVVREGTDDLVIYENQVAVDQISLSQYGSWASYPGLAVDEASNGDLIFGWLVGRDRTRSLVLARYCRGQRAFCNYRLIGKGPDVGSTISEQVPSMDIVALNNKVFAKWREDEWDAPPSLVITDLNLQNHRFIDLESIFSNGEAAWDVHLHEGRDGILLTGLQESSDSVLERLAFANWTPLEGWQAGEVIPTYPESGRGRATTHLKIREDNSGHRYILVVSGDPDQKGINDKVASRASVIRETEEGWFRAGSIDLDIESDGRRLDMVLSGDRLYVVYHSDGQIHVHHTSLSAAAFSFFEESIQVDGSFLSARVQTDQSGAIKVIADVGGFLNIIRADSTGLHLGDNLPISGGGDWISPIGDKHLVARSGDDYRVRVAIEMDQTLSPISNIIDFNTDPEEGYLLRPDYHDRLCPRWAVDYAVESVQLEQLSGPSLITGGLGGACVSLTIPRLAVSEQADMSVTLRGPDGPETVSQTFTVPAVDPVVTIDGPATILEGNDGELAVQVEHAYGNRYEGPYSISWTQLDGPGRALHYDQGWYTLWAPNVDQDTTSRYRAEVYFPEPDITREVIYEVLIQDTGTSVNLPPEIMLDVTAYSDFGYDMQKVTVGTDVNADVTLRMYGSWSMLQDGNQPEAIPVGDEPEADFGWRYVGPFSVILNPGQHINGMVRAETTDTGLVSYYSFYLGPPAMGPIDPRVIIASPDSLADGEQASFQAVTFADASDTEYTGVVEYNWSQLSGPNLGITAGQPDNPLDVALPDLQSDQDVTLEVSAYLPGEGITVTGQKTITLIDDESGGGQAPDITWTVEPYSAYGYDLNRVILDAGDAMVHMKIYGSWTMLSDGNQPTQVPSGSEPEPNYQYEYVAPFSILREPNNEMDITIRAQSPTSGLISYDRVIVDQNGGTAAPVN